MHIKSFILGKSLLVTIMCEPKLCDQPFVRERCTKLQKTYLRISDLIPALHVDITITC